MPQNPNPHDGVAARPGSGESLRPTIAEGVPPTLGPYEVLEKVGHGGMGIVFKARHKVSGEIVAVKVMNATLARHPVLLKRFEQEFRTASRLDHPNIVRGLDYGEHEDRPYLVMEFVEGETLADRVERDGRIEQKEAVRLIAQVAQGLRRAHKQGIIHRDVKPDNVLVTADGTAKLADLGLVREVETDRNLTRIGKALGTIQFMAPEQFRNAKNADVRSDVYSLAATLYVAVTAQLPFPGEMPEAWLDKVGNKFIPPRDHVPTLSRRLSRAICRALNPDPASRPGSARAFIEDVTGHSTRRTVVAEPEESPEELWYVAYVDPDNNLARIQASVDHIRQGLRTRTFGDPNEVRVSRTETGPFLTLHTLPEFSDLVLPPRVRGRDGR
jgi:eukaryotic-like serine/threonine-protein kinase